MSIYQSDWPGCCNRLRWASKPSMLIHAESIMSKVQIPFCKLWNTDGTWASPPSPNRVDLEKADRPHKHKQRRRQSIHAPRRDETNTQRERDEFCYSAFLGQRNSPSSYSIFISTSLTLSSQLLSVRNLRGRPRHALFGLWTPEFFLTDQKVVAETLSRLLDNRGAAAELWWVGDLRVRVGSAPQCEVNFSFFFLHFMRARRGNGSLFLGYLSTACTHFPVQMVWGPLGFILVALV